MFDAQEIQSDIFDAAQDDPFALVNEIANSASGRVRDNFSRTGEGHYDRSSTYRALLVGKQLGIDSIGRP